ncbi:unnamed protein product [Coffea canephora]|uniref:GH18 domain-containing protein n=1 Tax=Coffea canephora TaxID=49390 RepID=A0A068UNX2_COFCA|nr:unnamed protein product [Coffea canephora]
MASTTKFILLSLTLCVLHLNFCHGQNAVNAGYWFPDSGIEISDIDSTLFTHLFCAFADLDPESNEVTISASNAGPFSQFTETVQLKNPSVKTLLSIGGGNSNRDDFASMASQPTSRKSFIDSSINLARANSFHGLDLDWESPQSDLEMTNLGSLLDEWRAAVATEAQNSGKPQLILTAAVSYASKVDGLYQYPITSVSRSLDWINLMAYDFYAPDRPSTSTRCHAALKDPTGQASGSSGIADWENAGVGAKKLVLGIPFYGYAWRLANANNHGILAPANGAAGPDNGAEQYRAIRTFVAQTPGAVVVYNSTYVCNYCYAGTTWIGYDDTQTVSTKVSYAKQNGLLGYFAWHIGADDNFALSRQASQAWADGSGAGSHLTLLLASQNRAGIVE